MCFPTTGWSLHHSVTNFSLILTILRYMKVNWLGLVCTHIFWWEPSGNQVIWRPLTPWIIWLFFYLLNYFFYCIRGMQTLPVLISAENIVSISCHCVSSFLTNTLLQFVYLRDNLLSSVEGIEILKRVKVCFLDHNILESFLVLESSLMLMVPIHSLVKPLDFMGL